MDVYRHKVIVEKIQELMPFLINEDQSFFKNIIKKSNNVINNYNWKNRECINPTRKEIGGFNRFCKILLMKHYKNDDFINDEIDIFELVEKTKFSNHLKNSKILLGRKNNINSSLKIAILNAIKLEIIREFENQNKNFLTKYLTYETSK